MKPPSFKYHKASSKEEALELMEQHGYDAKILAGGQSLIPAMNFRLAQPEVLIDLNFIKDFSYVKEDRKKGLLIGAMTRYTEVEKSDLVIKKSPLLYETIPFVAHPQIRNRGTIGGSVAHADPAAELPAVMLALNAKISLEKKGQQRWVEIDDFFTGMFDTAMEPEEILTEIAVPHLPKRYGYAFDEIARRHGDYAIVGVAVSLSVDRKGRCEDARIVFLSVGDAPVFSKNACEMLKGQAISDELLKEVAHTAATKDIDPGKDIHASSEYRRHLANVLTQKTVKLAFARATK